MTAEALRQEAPTVLTPGIYTDVPDALYHGDPCGGVPVLSASIAKLLINDCPMSAWAAHPLLGGLSRERTEPMIRGSILDNLLAGGDAAFVELPFEEFRTKEAKAARDAAKEAGQIVFRAGELSAWKRKAGAIKKGLKGRGFDIDAYDKQITVIWHETATDGTQVLCKGRLDYLRGLEIADLKTSEELGDRSLTNKILAFGYHIQRAAYLSAMDHLYPEEAGRHRFNFYFASPEAPYPTRRVGLGGLFTQLGRVEWQKAVDLWAACMKSQQWPDWPDVDLEAPSYIGDRILQIGAESNVIPF